MSECQHGKEMCLHCAAERDQDIDILSQAQARIQELETLVQEIGEILQFAVTSPSKEHLWDFFPMKSREILSRPQVREIMEKKP